MLQDRFKSQTGAEFDSARIEIARVRLDRAERMVALRRSELETLPLGSATREEAVALLKLSERAAFNRRLELNVLLRARRERSSFPPISIP